MEFQYFYRLLKYLKINKKEIKKYRTLIVHLSAVFLPTLFSHVYFIPTLHTQIFVYPVRLILCLILLLIGDFFSFSIKSVSERFYYRAS